MHSGSTAHPASPPDPGPAAAPRRPSPGRRLPSVLLALVLLVVLAGCASDRAGDQGRARERAEETGGVIVADQATYAANRYASPTLTATATQPPPATVIELGLATTVSADGQPQNLIRGVATNGGRVYVVAEIDNARAGSAAAIYWQLNEQERDERLDVAYNEVTIAQDGRQWIAIPVDLNGSIRTGPVAVYLLIDGVQVGSLGISILSPGSAPQSV